jgi:hypothetical protein
MQLEDRRRWCGGAGGGQHRGTRRDHPAR